MLNLCVKFEEFSRDEKKITYVLEYNKEKYILFVPCDGKLHNKLYECEKKIPKELEWFVDTVISGELANRKCTVK